jgi:hypothetical protein
MVQCFPSAPGSGDSYLQVFLYPDLPDEITKVPRPEAGIKRYILSAWFSRYDALYLRFPPVDNFTDYTISLPGATFSNSRHPQAEPVALYMSSFA